MAQLHRQCHHHADRQAIGVCVITGKPICGECSTRYEGVNYSREGLALLQAQRAAAQRGGAGARLLGGMVLLMSPVMLYLLYVFYRLGFALLIDWQQWEPT